MTGGPGPFRSHLAPEESLIAVDSGTLVERGGRIDASIGVTDRRLLILTETEGFVDVAHDTIHAIRSRSERRLTRRELGVRALVGTGAVLTIGGVGGTALAAPNALAFVLALGVVAGVVAAEYLRRSEAAVTDAAVRRAVGRLGGTGTGAGSLAGKSRSVATVVGDRPVLPALPALLAVVAFVGLVAIAPGSLLLSLPVVTIGGLGIVDASRRQTRHLAENDDRWRRQRDVRVHLVDGRTIRFRVNAGATADRELSRLTCGHGFGAIDAEIAPQ